MSETNESPLMQSNDELLADAMERIPNNLLAGILAYSHASRHEMDTGWVLSKFADDLDALIAAPAQPASEGRAT